MTSPTTPTRPPKLRKVKHDPMDLMKAIAERWMREASGNTPDLTDTLMDLDATHNGGCRLDLNKLLYADRFTFLHDMNGIRNNVDRNRGRWGKTIFLPRCAAQAVKP